MKGDADAAIEGADVVVKGRYVTESSQGAPIEPRAILAEWHGDRVTVWSSTQVPYAARAGVAASCSSPKAMCESSSRCSGAGSAPSATSTSRATWPRSRGPPDAR